ncbi:serine protease [Streptomyces dioscori]|uniref:Serine protease n=1 Tax=Streptomyces dioscori TaxID=2109333 RepID=A0A2P8Q9M8_9ACTN|nr:S8 family serine peptidase [Streptomyces dioscori]PSM42953.1 serine protease [Streptomyces dioscori]
MRSASRRHTYVSGAAAAVSFTMLCFTVPAHAVGEPSVPVSASAPAPLPVDRDLSPARYVVTLAGAPTALYKGGVDGIAGTAPAPGAKVDTDSPDALRYRARLREGQDRAARAVGAGIRHRYSVVSNGFTADLTPSQVARLSVRPDVLDIRPDTWNKVADDSRATDLMGLSGRRGVWSRLGGSAKAGKGVVIGVIDSGVWPESRSFSAPALGSAPPSAKDRHRPYRSGGVIRMRKADGGTFTGICQTGEQFTANSCNTKLVGARYFGDGWLAQTPPEKRNDYVSPRDAVGHGTHTASTAAGAANVHVVEEGRDYGYISGVAPGAVVAVYKALWKSKDAEGAGMTSDIVEAVEQAVTDGVDVLNYSVSTLGGSPLDHPIQQAFRAAAAAGVFVSASAGNDGPDPWTVDNTAPWITTVAAGTTAPMEATVELGDGRTFIGGSSTVDAPLGPKRLVRADDVRNTGTDPAAALLCVAGSLDPRRAAGAIVLCDRGVTSRVSKSAEVERAGGVGMVLVNTSDLETDNDVHTVPTVHLNVPAATTVRDYAKRPDALVTLRPGGTSNTPYPQVAAFSSRGPAMTNKNSLIKPDVTAPGVGILAAVAPSGSSDRRFDFMSGTSMAAPQVSGLAALYFGVHPKWSAMAVKSALMTTARPTRTATGEAETDPFAQGSGHVTPSAMFEPGLVYDSSNTDWLAYQAGLGLETGGGAPPMEPGELNYPSVAVPAMVGTTTLTRTLTATRAGVYKASLTLPGIDAEVKPSTLRFTRAGQSAVVRIRLTQTTAVSGRQVTGSLIWKGQGHISVRSPVVVTPFSVLAPERVVGSTAQGGVSFPVTPGTKGMSMRGYGPVVGPQVRDEVSAAGDGVRSFALTVPEGSMAGEFFLTTDDPDARLQLMLVTDPANGSPSKPVGGLGEYAHRSRVGVLGLAPGRYLALVVDLGDLPGTSSTAFSLRSNVVGAGANFPGAATLTVSSEATPRPGVPMTVTAAWPDLKGRGPATAYIAYPNGAGTLVSIED